MAETDGPRQGRETDALRRALRAPGTETELAEEDRYRAMFRDGGGVQPGVQPGAPLRAPLRAQPGAELGAPTSIRSRTPRRIVVSAAAAAALAVATGGVAAAYTGSLPEPIQTLAHHVIGAPRPSAAPAPRATDRPGPPSSSPDGSAAPGSGSSSSAHPQRRPTHRAGRPSSRPSATASQTPASGTTTGPTPTPTTEPTTSPSAVTATAAPVVTGVTVAGTSHLADVGGRVSFTGQVSVTDGVAATHRKVVLQQQVGHRWLPVAHGNVGPTGLVTLLAPPLQRSTVYRLHVAHVHSTSWRVAMHPLISTTVSASRKVATVTAAVLGGQAGDRVLLLTRRDGATVTVGRARLGVDSTVSFLVTPDTRTSHYVVAATPTQRHTGSQVGVQVRLTGKEAGSRSGQKGAS